MPRKKWFDPCFARALIVFLIAAAPDAFGQLAPGYHPDRIMVIPKPGREAALVRMHSREGSNVRRVLSRVGGIQVIQLPRGRSPVDAVARYRNSGCVIAAEVDGVLEAAGIPNDPQILGGSQWGLHNFGQGSFRPDADIDAPEAWDIRTTATNIIVAVIDSGARLTHLDLVENLWTNPNEIASNGVDDDGPVNGISYIDDVHGIDAINNSGNPVDTYQHGTHVTGIIGAVGNNSFGMAGVVWHGQIMICRFLNGNGSGFVSDAIECINYALAKGAKVINASFTGRQSDFQNLEFYMLSNAIVSCRNAGVIVVAAAGNSANNNELMPFFPASYNLSNIVAVMATDPWDEVWRLSNYGATTVDLGAPGAGINSTWYSSDFAYDELSGTSMATAFVTGAIALVWAQYPNDPYWRIIERILAGVDPLPSLTGRCVTGGRLNLRNSLDPRPRLSVARSETPDTYRVNLWGAPSQVFVLEASSDYADWTPVATNSTAVNGRLSFTITAAATAEHKVFRAIAGQATSAE